MILYNLTDEELLDARKRAIQLGTLHKSFTRGRGNELGMQGEYAVAAHIGATPALDTYDYDLVSPEGIRVEVKSKGTTRKDEPLDHYMVSVATANTSQGCDVYFFTRVIVTKSKLPLGAVWVLGYMPRQEFYSRAVFYAKGDTDPDNGYRVHQDCWNVPISDLYSWNEYSEAKIIG